MRLGIVLAIVVAGSACQREPSPARDTTPSAAPSAPQPAQKAPHGSGLPFEMGKMPKIEDLPVDDLGKFLGGTAWCRREAERTTELAFAIEGTWARTEEGASGERGSWRVDRGRIVLDGADGGSRTVDVQAGKVDGKPVVAFDGLLYGACEPTAR
ncbi:MAG: hypothetical protein WBV82_16155 [Myxococcaceae bacterium]